MIPRSSSVHQCLSGLLDVPSDRLFDQLWQVQHWKVAIRMKGWVGQVQMGRSYK